MADQTMIDMLMQTWPGRLAQGAVNGFMAPGNALASQTPITSEQMIAPAMDMAGMMIGGGMPAAEKGALGAAGGNLRALPTNNYLTPISRYTPEIYREMSPQAAVEAVPNSLMQSSSVFGAPRKYYADTPDLALGQGSNVGVRMKFDSSPFEGIINTQKPGWQSAWQQGMGEYLASPMRDENMGNALLGMNVDKSAMKDSGRVYSSLLDRAIRQLSDAGWAVNDSGKIISVTKPKASP